MTALALGTHPGATRVRELGVRLSVVGAGANGNTACGSGCLSDWLACPAALASLTDDMLTFEV